MRDERLEARLFILSGADLARSFALGERALVGRGEGCEVVLADRSISRKHALLARDASGWFVQDMGSTNGIARGGKRLERFELADGDEFKLGDLSVRFKLVPAGDEELEFAAPVVAPKPAAVAVPVAKEVEVELEIELDGQSEPVVAPPAARAREPLAATHFRAPRSERRSGLLGSELEQQPLWLRGVFVLVLAVLAGVLAWGAYLAVRLLRAG
jgi:predicted component of type VI protein secretion system